MLHIRRLICLFLIAVLMLSSLSACRTGEAPAAARVRPHAYLVVGFDDAAQNTDVLFLLSFDPSARQAAIVQIPRDTYLSSGVAQEKINQLFSGARASGATPREALKQLKSTVTEVLGVPLDAVIGLSLAAFRETVDLIGGVDITLDAPLTLDKGDGGDELTLDAGTHHLDGEMAEYFVRHRRSYAMADLSRMDAQKIFLSAFLSALRSRIGAREVIRLGMLLGDSYVTDASFMTLLDTAVRYIPLLQSTGVVYATLPGEPVLSQTGLSYYAVNRKGASEVLSTYFGTAADSFDPSKRLLRAGDIAFENIYYDSHLSYRIYRDTDAIRLPPRA